MKVKIEDLTVENGWVDIKDFEGNYKINVFGQVVSVPRTIIRSNGSKMFIKGGYLKEYIIKGTKCVNLVNNNKHYTKSVNKLLKECFSDNYNEKSKCVTNSNSNISKKLCIAGAIIILISIIVWICTIMK